MTDKEAVKKYQSLFWKKVRKTAKCWVWLGYITPNGYGRYGIAKRSAIYAHRFALLSTGLDIPKDKVIDHICRNRACVNPKHLRIVNIETNVLENSESPSAQNKAKTHCKRGHELSGSNLKTYKSGRRCLKCGKIQQKNRKPRSWKKGKNYGKVIADGGSIESYFKQL